MRKGFIVDGVSIRRRDETGGFTKGEKKYWEIVKKKSKRKHKQQHIFVEIKEGDSLWKIFKHYTGRLFRVPLYWNPKSKSCKRLGAKFWFRLAEEGYAGKILAIRPPKAYKGLSYERFKRGQDKRHEELIEEYYWKELEKMNVADSLDELEPKDRREVETRAKTTAKRMAKAVIEDKKKRLVKQLEKQLESRKETDKLLDRLKPRQKEISGGTS